MFATKGTAHIVIYRFDINNNFILCSVNAVINNNLRYTKQYNKKKLCSICNRLHKDENTVPMRHIALQMFRKMALISLLHL